MNRNPAIRPDDRARFVAALDEGLADVAAGRVITHAELGKALDERFGTLATAKRAKPKRR